MSDNIFYTVRADGKIGKEATRLGLFTKYVDEAKSRIMLTVEQFNRVWNISNIGNINYNNNEKKTMVVYNKNNRLIHEDNYNYAQTFKKSGKWPGVIQINLSAYIKMHYYTQAARGEISGFCKARREGNNFIINDIRIFKQTCTSGGTTLTQDALTDFVVELVKEGTQPSDWGVWWHTHNDFGVFFSSTDDNAIELLQPTKKHLVVAVCMNKKGEMVGRVDDDVTEFEAQVIILDTDHKDIKEECYREVKEKVKHKGYAYSGKRWKKKWKQKKNDWDEGFTRRWNHNTKEWDYM